MLRCPVCHTDLKQIEQRFECMNHHSFDIAKNGSVYLSKTHSLKERGDNKLQIEARHQFLQKDHYKLFKDSLVEVLSEYPHTNILDIGCGEGYYTQAMAEAFENDTIYGLDLSKEAIHFASKSKNDIQYMISNSHDLPFVDKRVDVITALFTPLYLEEIIRVLKPTGYLITVQAGNKHLLEMKERLYDKVILNDEKAVQDIKLTRIKTLRLSQRLYLDKESKNQLLMMTPYYYTSPQDKVQAFLDEEKCDLTISAVINVYQRKP